MYSMKVSPFLSLSYVLLSIVFLSKVVTISGSMESDSDSVSLRGSSIVSNSKAAKNGDAQVSCMDTKAKTSPIKIQLKDTEKWKADFTLSPKKKVDMQFYSQVYTIKNSGTQAICHVDFELALGDEIEYEIVGYTLLEQPDMRKKNDNNYFVATLPPIYTGPILSKTSTPFAFTLGTKDIDLAPKKLPKICITSYQFCEAEDIPNPSPPLLIDVIDDETKTKKQPKLGTSARMEPYGDYVSSETEKEYEESVQDLEEKKDSIKEDKALLDDEALALMDDDLEGEDDSDQVDDSIDDDDDDDNFADYKDDEYEYDRRS